MRGNGIKITNDYDLQVSTRRDAKGQIIRGLVIGETLQQNTGLILISHSGEFKENPLLGVGIEDILLDNDYLEWRRKIRISLELDRQNVTRINFNSVENLQIDAKYNS